jgi:hypothetical protein
VNIDDLIQGRSPALDLDSVYGRGPHRPSRPGLLPARRRAAWRPSLGPDHDTFRMTDLLLFAFEGKADLLNALGD